MVTLHSSWRGIVLSFGGVLILAGVAVAVRLNGASAILSLMFALLALGSGLITVLDLPIATEFDSTGVTRRALLRRQHISWERITRLTRTRVGIVRTVRTPAAGGLVAEVGRRRYLLVDKRESQTEFDELRLLIGKDRADRFGLSSDFRPPEATPPTWLYRRKKWRPVP